MNVFCTFRRKLRERKKTEHESELKTVKEEEDTNSESIDLRNRYRGQGGSKHVVDAKAFSYPIVIFV